MAKRKWTKELIIESILDHEKKGNILTSAEMKKTDSALVGAGVSYFGNWGKAIKAAGLDYKKIQSRAANPKWTKDKIIETIKELMNNEADLSYSYMKKKHSSLVSAACNYFGSWKNAMKNCGVDYTEVVRKGATKRVETKKWRGDLLLERLDTLNCIDEKTVREKHPKFYEMLTAYFSSWRNAVTALRKWQSDK